MGIFWAESSVIQVSFYHSEVDLSKESLGLDINLTQCMFRVPLDLSVNTPVVSFSSRLGCFPSQLNHVFLLTETRYCYTQHTMEVTGNSISVTKRCVPLEDCLSTGCRDSEHEGHKVWQQSKWWDTIGFLLSRCPLGLMSSMSLLPHVGWLLTVFIPLWKDASFHVGAKRIKN